MKRLPALAISSIIILLFSGIVLGQDFEGQRRIEEEKRKALEKTELEILKGEERFVIDFGGYFNYRYDDYDEDDNDSSITDTLNYTYSFDMRCWMRAAWKPPPGASYQNEHSIYVRWKDIRTERRPDEINQGHDHDGPDLDYAYLVLDVRPVWFEIGRRYFSAGQGISYSNVHDGIEVFSDLGDWNLKGFASHTLPDEDNIDAGVPGYDKEGERVFLGAEATFLGISDHGLYGYFVIQKDNSDEDIPDFLHDYTYDSQYFGLGSQGKLAPTMHYWAEVIKETGKSRIYDTNERRDINAWAGDFGVSYDWNIYSHPNISVEYAFGSGDTDRINVTDTLDGNTLGDDKNFLYFGYLPAGYAFSPRLSNLHFLKAGVLLKPLEGLRLFRNLMLGADYYYYYKNKRIGGISDGDALIEERDIGNELDISVSWQVLSDVRWSLEYGRFNPGGAYPNSANKSEDYFSTDVTVTF